MKKLYNLFNKKVLLFTAIIWLFLNITGIQNSYFFNNGSLRISAIVIMIKILHFFFLYIIFAKLYALYTQRHKKEIKQEIIVSLVYMVIFGILLLLTWPGIWSWDDIFIVQSASLYGLSAWQHFFSGLFQILCLQTIPIASGVLIIQVLITSLIIGYCITNISRLFGKNEKQERIMQFVLGLIVLAPPLITYILSGFRMGLYSYLELLLITKVIILFKEQKPITLLEIIKIIFFTVLVSSWRTEGLYYPFLILILLLMLGKKIVSKKTSIVIFVLIMICNIVVGKFNNFIIGNNNYSISATMEPVTAIVKISDESDKDEIDKINKVLDVEYILDNPEWGGEKYFWTDGVIRNYTDEEYSDYLKASLKLIFKYPDVAFKGILNIFIKTGSGLGDNNIQTTRNMIKGSGNTLKLFDSTDGAGQQWDRVNSKLKAPISLNVRNAVISFLCGADSEGNLTIIHNIFWNLFIPFGFILFCLIYKLIKKDYFMVFLILTVVARIPLVFITAPAPYFMYYLSAYLCTYIISAIVIFEGINELINKKKSKIIENNTELSIVKKNNKEKIIKIFKQFLSFLLVSGVGWLIDFTIYFLLTHFAKLNVALANVISSIPAITYVFLISTRKIFKSSTSKISLKYKYLIYFGYQLILVSCVSLFGEFLHDKLINIITISFLLNNLKMVIKILITPITMTINFIVMKNLIERL